MAKIAQTHDGKEIQFPDETPDDHIDRAMEALHGGGGEPPDPLEVIMQAVVGSIAKTQKKSDGADSSLRKEDVAFREKAHNDKQNAMGSIVKTVENAIQALGPISDIPSRTEALTEAVNNLAKVVEDGVKKIIMTLHLPADISYDEATGKPKHMQRRLTNAAPAEQSTIEMPSTSKMSH